MVHSIIVMGLTYMYITYLLTYWMVLALVLALRTSDFGFELGLEDHWAWF